MAQTLAALLVDMENFKVLQDGRVSVVQRMDRYQDATREVLHNVRQLLSDLRGEPALELRFADTIATGLIKSFEERTGIQVRLSIGRAWPQIMSRTAALNLYRIIQESLTNAWLHGEAKLVHVALRATPDNNLILMIRDNGRGLLMAGGAGMGLLGMNERASELGGHLHVESKPGRGTTVRCTFPRENFQ